MDLNRLTQKSQEALHDAQTKALRFGHTLRPKRSASVTQRSTGSTCSWRCSIKAMG